MCSDDQNLIERAFNMVSNRRDTSQLGFTLIELLIVIAIIGVLTLLGMTAFRIYQANAGYAVAARLMQDARTAFEAGVSDFDNPPSTVSLTSQVVKGPVSDPSARSLLPGLMIPGSVKFQVSYDSTCQATGCQSGFIQVNHCQGHQYLRYLRFGDGSDILIPNVAGDGCS